MHLLLSAQVSRSGSLHPKANAFSGAVHAQKDPSGTEEILATSKYGLPSTPTLPVAEQKGRGDRAMGQQAGRGHMGVQLFLRARFPGGQDSVLQVERGAKKGMGAGVGPGLGKCQITPCMMPVPWAPADEQSPSQRQPHIPRSPFPRGRLKPPPSEAGSF